MRHRIESLNNDTTVEGFWDDQENAQKVLRERAGLEHTVNIVPEICMTFVATRETVQVFAIQAGTIEKYKQKWLSTVEKYYSEILPAQKAAELEMVAVSEDN